MQNIKEKNRLIEKVVCFIDDYVSNTRIYESYVEKFGNELNRDDFLEVFNDLSKSPHYHIDERLAIENKYKHITFDEMVRYNLNGVKYPDQEKQEILFELMSKISAHLDSSEGNLHRLEILKQRWFIAQKEESRTCF